MVVPASVHDNLSTMRITAGTGVHAKARSESKVLMPMLTGIAGELTQNVHCAGTSIYSADREDVWSTTVLEMVAVFCS